MATSSKETLLRLLQENRQKYHVEYHGYLSNHLPMALISLYQMGSSAQRLQEFNDFYVERLEPSIPSTKSINKANWMQHLGERKFYNDYREFFKAERSQFDNIQRLVAQYLPILVEGVVGGAFHPILLLGYGVELMNLDEELILDGLAYMAYAFKSLGKLPATPVSRKTYLPKDLLKRVYNMHTRRLEYSDPKTNFPTKIGILVANEIKNLDKFDKLKLDYQHDTAMVMDEIAGAMIGLYSTTQDFFVLHGVTGSFAFKLALSCLNPADKPLAIRYFMRALMGVYIIQGQPNMKSVNTRLWNKEINEISWESILRAGIASYDEHVIKFVWTCWKENKEHKRPLYILCAGQKAGVIEKGERTLWWPWALAGAAIIGGLVKYRTAQTV